MDVQGTAASALLQLDLAEVPGALYLQPPAYP
jgi:hypothetical protein